MAEYRQDLLEAMAHIVCTETAELPYGSMMEHIVTELGNLRARHRTLYFIGNGGSAAIAIHMTGDFLSNGKIRTRSMHDPATLTCIANDFGYAHVFSKQLDLVADTGDFVVAISSSGRSPNILRAVESARENACKIITLSGFEPSNPLRQMGDYNFYVPSMAYGIVETLHNMILQQIVDELMARTKERGR